MVDDTIAAGLPPDPATTDTNVDVANCVWRPNVGSIVTLADGTAVLVYPGAPIRAADANDGAEVAEIDKSTRAIEHALAQLARNASTAAQAAEDRGNAIDTMLAQIRDVMSQQKDRGST